MVEHRKTVARKAYVPSSWFIVLSVMLVLGGVGWIGWLLVGSGSDDSPEARPSVSSPATSAPAPSTSPTTEPAPSPSPSDEPTPSTPAPDDVTRDVQVSVLNNSGVGGAARAFSAKVTAAGWTLGGIGNWTGSIVSNTVYYPPGFQPQAELLADDVGIDRVRPSVAPMRTDRLTIILSGPQS